MADFDEIVAAATRARLFERERRSLLLAGLPPEVVGSLPDRSRPREQMLSDLHELRRLSLGRDRPPLLTVWLANAIGISSDPTTRRILSSARGKLIAEGAIEQAALPASPKHRRRVWVVLLLLAATLAVIALGRTVLDRPKETVVATAPESTQRFQATPCGSIVDRNVGLEWFVGPDRSMWRVDAETWIAQLDACGGGWVVPTSAQAKSLFDPGKSAGIGYRHPKDGRRYPARISPVFDAIGEGAWIWVEHPDSRKRLWAFNFYIGKAVIIDPSDQTLTLRAFAVRPVKPG